MRKQMLVRALAVCGVTLISASLALAGDNWIGTWKLNVAKSKYNPGPAPKSGFLKFDPSPDGIKLTQEMVNADGKAMPGGYTAKFDGKEVAYAGNPDADMATPKRIDDNSYQNTWKKAGKVTITAKVVVAADGKCLTVTQSGTNSKGRDRQQRRGVRQAVVGIRAPRPGIRTPIAKSTARPVGRHLAKRAGQGAEAAQGMGRRPSQRTVH